MIGDGYIKSHKIEHRIHEPFGLAQTHSEDATQRQGRFDRKIGIPGLTTSRFSPWCAPSGQCFRRHPQCKTATPTQACLVLRPIRHPEFRLCNVMTTIGVVFVRHGTRIKLIAILFAYRRNRSETIHAPKPHSEPPELDRFRQLSPQSDHQPVSVDYAHSLRHASRKTSA